MRCVNKKVGVEPYEPSALKAELKNGLAFSKQAAGTVELKVVFGATIDGEEVVPGDILLFEERTLNEELWAKKPLSVGGKSVIFADALKVIAIKKAL